MDHSPVHPVNYCQPATASGTHPRMSDTSLNRLSSGALKRGSGEVQHVAIAESDIIGWTADGRLLVQMQAPGGLGIGGAGAAGNNPAPPRRASTGIVYHVDRGLPPCLCSPSLQVSFPPLTPYKGLMPPHHTPSPPLPIVTYQLHLPPHLSLHVKYSTILLLTIRPLAIGLFLSHLWILPCPSPMP